MAKSCEITSGGNFAPDFGGGPVDAGSKFPAKSDALITRFPPPPPPPPGGGCCCGNKSK